MPFNLLLIPLLGGYIFVRYWNNSKIHMLRADKDRMLIRASIAGFIFLVLAFAVSILFEQLLLPCDSETKCLYTWWKRNIPFDYMGVSLLAFTFASIAWIPINWFCPWDKAVERAMILDADPLELALKRSQDETLALAITLQTGKVYIGIVTHQFNPATPNENIAILPLQSGYRDEKTKQMFLPVNYAVIVKAMRNRIDALSQELWVWKETTSVQSGRRKPKTAAIAKKTADDLYDEWNQLNKRIDLFEVFIPYSQIVSVFFYDDMTYREYFEPKNADS